MNKTKTELGFVDSDERLTKLSGLLESAAAKHVGDLHVFRAKAIVDAILMVNYINYDVIELVVKALDDSSETTLDILDARDMAFDILADMPIGYRVIPPDKHLSPTDEIALTRQAVCGVIHELADEGLLKDSGNGVFLITPAGREYAHQLENAENGDDTNPPFTLDDDTQELPPLNADGICSSCRIFASADGELCEICADLVEVGNGD